MIKIIIVITIIAVLALIVLINVTGYKKEIACETRFPVGGACTN